MKTSNKLRAFSAVVIAFCLYCYTRPISETAIKASVVKITNEHGECSGEQVIANSGVSYILSAGHCANLKDSEGDFTITLENGVKLKRKFIAEDPYSDLLLIEGVPGIPGLKLASEAAKDEHVRTFTHGNNMNTYKTEGQLIEDSDVNIPLFAIESPEQKDLCRQAKNSQVSMDTLFGSVDVCLLSVIETASTAKIVPGSSGGSVVNDSGELVGVASATDGTFSMFVRLSDIRFFLSGY
jgi:hypothetical protein